jgi:transcriptional regulator with XRE-family HTH domain
MEHPLRTYRRKVGATQRQLAERLGISLPSLCRLEKNQQWPSRDLMGRIVTETGGFVSPEDFLPPKANEALVQSGCQQS